MSGILWQFDVKGPGLHALPRAYWVEKRHLGYVRALLLSDLTAPFN